VPHPVFFRNPLFSIFVLPVVVDVVGTVLGQPSEYWHSGYRVVDEALPIFFLLQWHPLAFIGACLAVWLPCTYALVRRLPAPYDLWIALSLFAGHSYNSIGWLRRSLYQAGLFVGTDQLSQALSIIPVALYMLLVGYVASRGLLAYFRHFPHTS
jgi:hypothetical protein